MMSVNNYGNSETLLQNGLNFLNNKSLLFSRQLHFFLPIANSLKPMCLFRKTVLFLASFQNILTRWTNCTMLIATANIHIYMYCIK